MYCDMVKVSPSAHVYVHHMVRTGACDFVVVSETELLLSCSPKICEIRSFCSFAKCFSFASISSSAASSSLPWPLYVSVRHRRVSFTVGLLTAAAAAEDNNDDDDNNNNNNNNMIPGRP